ncbi:hypothetical protein B0H13DRAFT_1866151 [Mycena leptocephala]|nr:hypothetical protein B0H13DRAFT_1866151 [Mycena leptocephala]
MHAGVVRTSARSVTSRGAVPPNAARRSETARNGQEVGFKSAWGGRWVFIFVPSFHDPLRTSSASPHPSPSHCLRFRHVPLSPFIACTGQNTPRRSETARNGQEVGFKSAWGTLRVSRRYTHEKTLLSVDSELRSCCTLSKAVCARINARGCDWYAGHRKFRQIPLHARELVKLERYFILHSVVLRDVVDLFLNTSLVSCKLVISPSSIGLCLPLRYHIPPLGFAAATCNPRGLGFVQISYSASRVCGCVCEWCGLGELATGVAVDL